MSETKTVKVRIAVGVSANGEWNSSGWGNALNKAQPKDEEKMNFAVEALPNGEKRYWLEAELPLPEVLSVIAPKITEA